MSCVRYIVCFRRLAVGVGGGVLRGDPAGQAPQAPGRGSTSSSPTAGSSTAPARRGSAATSASSATASPPSARSAGATAATTIDATNLVVSPGFIDLLGQSEFNVLVDGRAASKILQGITTEVTGEGSSIAPVNDRMIQEASANATYFGVAQDWRTLADYFKRHRGAVAHDRSTSRRLSAPAAFATT